MIGFSPVERLPACTDYPAIDPVDLYPEFAMGVWSIHDDHSAMNRNLTRRNFKMPLPISKKLDPQLGPRQPVRLIPCLTTAAETGIWNIISFFHAIKMVVVIRVVLGMQ